ncbi:hypothetical protein RN001_001204 [Aquatica leii]|uniref:Uncharacterized protein n=1 Tax=Aquatica leii TaxID=1421715 RepID=A0AAN7PG37_9COLE|nr:hypothetical protein RN001_001204 [Aquatica leii]
MTNGIVFILLSAFILPIISSKLDSCKEVTLGKSTILLKCKDIRAFPVVSRPVGIIECINCNIPILNETTSIKNFRGDTFKLTDSNVQKIALTAFAEVSTNVRSFIFTNNAISYIEPQLFSKFSKLYEISFRNNTISNLQPQTFAGLNLDILDLSQNFITTIVDVFSGLKIRDLNLSSNAITEIPENALNKVSPNLFKCSEKSKCFRKLYLHHNAIKVIENKTFTQLKNLEYLSLHSNQIAQLYKNSFKNLTHLMTLELQNNRLSQIPIGIFSDLEKLRTLDISQNSITNLNSNIFSGLINLNKLNISHNSLYVLDNILLLRLGKLNSLDISDIRIHKFNIQELFQHLFRLLQFYEIMNKNTGGFNYPSHYVDVSNMHGIACSRKKLQYYNDLSFEEFLKVIAEDKTIEDVINIESRNNQLNSEIKNIHVKFTLKMFNKIVLLLITICAFSAALDSCQEIYGRYFIGRSIQLKCKNVDKFPSVTKTVTKFECLDCNITILNEHTSIKKFQGEMFNLSNSHIQKITTTAFAEVSTNVRSFLLNNNEISFIDPLVFSKFRILYQIRLRNNKIFNLKAKTFSGLDLTILDLSENYITNISNAFDGLIISNLNLSSNSINEIQENAFDKILIWKDVYQNAYLDLSSNKIEKIHPNLFKCTEKTNCFRQLYLQQNAIKTIENCTFCHVNKLQYLFLHSNNIEQLHKDSFKNLYSLIILQLQNNKLSDLPIGIFNYFQKLQTLDISKNFFTNLKIGSFFGLINLNNLNISHNQLHVLDTAFLTPLGKLNTLDISSNKIHDLNIEELVHHLIRLRILVINDNFWTCNQLMQFYKVLNKKIGAWKYTTQHYNVPNLHGIACSRQVLQYYDDLSFEEFLTVIAQEKVIEEIVNEQTSERDLKSETIKFLKNIYVIDCLLVIVTLMSVVIFLKLIVQFVLYVLEYCNVIKKH